MNNNFGVIGETTWHVPFVMGVITAGAVMYMWPQKKTFFGNLGYMPRHLRRRR